MSERSISLDPSNWLAEHGDTLFGYALTRLRDRDAAEEVVQEAFLSALRNAKQYRQTGSQGAWLMGILKRKVIDYMRAGSKQPMQWDTEDSEVSSLFDERGNWSQQARKASPLALDSIERGEFSEILRGCLGKLPESQAAAFELKEVQQESAENVCKVLGITPSNLWVLMHRARLRLAECIKARWALGDA